MFPTTLEDLAAALDRIQAEDLATVGNARLQGEIDLVHQLKVRLEAESLRRAAEWKGRGLWAETGARSARAELARRWGLGVGGAGDRLAVAARLSEAPLTRAAFARGELSYEEVRLLTAAVADDVTEPVKEKFRACEQALVDAARVISYAKTAEMMAFWHAHADPEGHCRDHNHKHDRRGLSVSKTFDGMVAVDGLLDPETGQIVLRALEHIGNQLWRDEHHRSGAERRGCEVPGLPSRTPRQLRADALGELARIALGYDRAHDTFDGRAHDRPRITAIVDTDTLAGRPGNALLGDLHTPLPPDAAQRLLCDARLSTVVTSHQFLPLAMSRSSGQITPAQRVALILRDGTCAFPGCELPPRCCDAHHLHQRRHGGLHHLDNLVLLCHRHHRLVHDHRWTCALDPTTGRPAFTDPRGHTHHADPSPLQVAGYATRSAKTGPNDDHQLPLVS